MDPSAARLIAAPRATAPRFLLKLHETEPEDIEPLGDRYVVEVIDIDESVEFGQLLVITQATPQRPGDPQADPTIENRGVLAAVVIRAGNGHLLGLPDIPRPNAPHKAEADHEMLWSAVPMFMEPGDVVLVDHNAKGRALKIVGRECRIVSQIDCLAKIEGVRLKRENRTWVQE
jgi:co-chaperonin GroES (HSP10)